MLVYHDLKLTIKVFIIVNVVSWNLHIRLAMNDEEGDGCEVIESVCSA